MKSKKGKHEGWVEASHYEGEGAHSCYPCTHIRKLDDACQERQQAYRQRERETKVARWVRACPAEMPSQSTHQRQSEPTGSEPRHVKQERQQLRRQLPRQYQCGGSDGGSRLCDA